MVNDQVILEQRVEMVNTWSACALMLSLSQPVAMRTPSPTANPLPMKAAQSQAIAIASSHSEKLNWRVFEIIVKGQPRVVVVLGEDHLAIDSDVRIARDAIDQFEYFAVENNGPHQDPRWSYKVENVAAVFLSLDLTVTSVIRGLSLPNYYAERGYTLKSPMEYVARGARTRYVHNVEQLHVPRASEEIQLFMATTASPLLVGAFGLFVVSLLVAKPNHSLAKNATRILMFANAYMIASLAFARLAGDPLLTNRDVTMAQYINQWAKIDLAETGPLFVVVGSGHSPGLERLLTTRYGFRSLPVIPLTSDEIPRP